MTLNLAVIGTSNSVMQDGWTRYASERGSQTGVDVHNLSLGGSSSRFGAYMLSDGKYPEDADRIVIDFCINDQMFLDAGGLDLDDVSAHYGSMISSAWRRERLDSLLVLMFPQQRFASPATENPLFETMISVLGELSIPYLDFRHDLSDWADTDDVSIDDAFIDPRHFVPDFQSRIADRVLDWCESDQPSRRSHRAINVIQSIPEVHYRDLEIGGGEDARQLEVGTSLVTKTVQQFIDGSSLSLTGADHLAAVLIWTQDNSGSLRFHGPDGPTRLCCRREIDRYFLFDTLTPVVPIGDGLRVDAIHDPAVPFYRVLSLKSSMYDHDGSTVEVVAFIGCDGDPRDIARYLDDQLGRTPPLLDRVTARIRRVSREVRSLARDLRARATTGTS